MIGDGKRIVVINNDFTLPVTLEEVLKIQGHTVVSRRPQDFKKKRIEIEVFFGQEKPKTVIFDILSLCRFSWKR